MVDNLVINLLLANLIGQFKLVIVQEVLTVAIWQTDRAILPPPLPVLLESSGQVSLGACWEGLQSLGQY